MERQRTAPHIDAMQITRFRQLAAAAACVCGLAAASAYGGDFGNELGTPDYDRQLVAVADVPPRPLLEPRMDVPEAGQTPGRPVLEANETAEPLLASTRGGQRLPSALFLDGDGTSLGIEGGNPVALLLGGAGKEPLSAPSAATTNKIPSVVASAATPPLSPSTENRTGPIFWTIAAIAACGLGVAGLKGPFLATRWTPARRGMRP